MYYKVILVPNTESVRSPMEIREIVDEMIKAEPKRLPKFQYHNHKNDN